MGPWAGVLLEKWQNGCATKSRGHQDTHSRAAQTEGLIGTRASTMQTSRTQQVPLITKEPQHSPRKPRITWQIHQERTGWGQGLVPDAAGGSSREEHEFKHSLYPARWPGQTASQMQTVGSRCNRLTKLGRNITGLSFPSGTTQSSSS